MSHFGPRPQDDAQAANSAAPDTDRQALWDDEAHWQYVLATEHSGYTCDGCGDSFSLDDWCEVCDYCIYCCVCGDDGEDEDGNEET